MQHTAQPRSERDRTTDRTHQNDAFELLACQPASDQNDLVWLLDRAQTREEGRT
ncbi:hypothetical protein [Marivita sp. GX14005]|uniref:hypothetical protein n=1 Tax=Marivita sp. GX14005 TaxID=2942276 RepID=UPI002019D1F1|nr:hypothetical protein [Marivita sp. GX14005]MCL3883151.1 hypothetical protein [Marivita sp. GX14005]